MVILLILGIIFLLMTILAIHIIEESYYFEEKVLPIILGLTFISLSVICFLCYGEEKAYKNIEEKINSGEIKIEQIETKIYRLIR